MYPKCIFRVRTALSDANKSVSTDLTEAQRYYDIFGYQHCTAMKHMNLRTILFLMYILVISTQQLSWFNPSQQICPTQPLTYLFDGIWEGFGKGKLRKLMG